MTNEIFWAFFSGPKPLYQSLKWSDHGPDQCIFQEFPTGSRLNLTLIYCDRNDSANRDIFAEAFVVPSKKCNKIKGISEIYYTIEHGQELMKKMNIF